MTYIINPNHNASMLKYLNKRYATDDTFREKIATKNRDRYHNDPEYKARLVSRSKAMNMFKSEYRALTKIDVF